MTEYIELKAAVDLAMQYCPDDDGACSKADRDIRELLDELEALPAADVVPVVRCRDCARLNRNGYCTRFQNNISGIATSWFMPDDDDFCSYGERKE